MKLDRPLVSVIIPTLKSREKMLQRALNSVYNQTYEPIQILVQIDGKNVQDARNRAAAKAKGKYIAFLDDDDEFYPDKLMEQIDYMEKNKDVGLTITWADDERFGLYHQYQPKEWWSFDELISGFNITCTSTFVIRKDMFDKIGKMDDTLLDSHEYDLAIRAAMVSKVYCIQKSLTLFHDSDEKDNWSYHYDRKITGMLQFINKWGKYFDKRRWFNTTMCLVLFTIGLVNHSIPDKILTSTKMKMERIGQKCRGNSTLWERFKA